MRKVAEHEARMRELDRRVWADEPLTPAESHAWRKWAGHLPSEPRSKKKRKNKKLPRAPRPRFGRPCALQRQVPAVQGVRAACASDSVHLRPLDIPVVQQRQVRGSMVLKTVVVPQLQSIEGRRHPFRDAEADHHGPCSADHGDSAVAAHCGRCPCCAGRADSQVLPWRRPWRSHSCSSLRNRHSLSSDCRKLQIFRSCSSSRSFSSFRDDESLPHGPCDHRDSPVAFEHGSQCTYYAGRAGVRPCRGAEAHSHGPDCSADQRDSPVAVRRQVVDVPVVDVYVQKTAEIPQLQLIYKG